MKEKNSKNLEEKASSYRKSECFTEAGEYYTAAAYNCLQTWPPGRFPVSVSHGAYFLLLAATCYRLAGLEHRCRNRCQQGILIAEDLLERVPDDDFEADYDLARWGAWYEFIGDFRLVGGMADFDQSYQDAQQFYRKSGNPPAAHREQEHMWLMHYFKSVVAISGFDEDEWLNFMRAATLTEWVDRKRNSLPDAFDVLLEQDSWLFPGES